MSSANLSREETAARSVSLTVHTARVELDLTTAPHEGETGFTTVSTLQIETDAAAPGSADTGVETWVDFIGEAVEAVDVDGIPHPVEWDGARIRIGGLRGRHSVRIAARAAYSRSGEGMHRFVDPVDGQTYLYTHYEPADARRVMACFEQPDMKARYTFVVTAPAGWAVLSNQAVAERTTEGGAQRVVFAETLPISTYITSVAAGPYHRVEGSGAVASRSCRWASTAGRRSPSTSTPTRSSRSPGRVSTFSPTPSATRTRGASTTRSSCPSTTSARWRTRVS
nr:hypothetical protein GCM10025699_26330 [Microbacterium flavescens]